MAWRSKLQASVSMSTAEAEFIAASSTATEVVWLRRILHDLGAPQHDATPLYEDNNACILLSENPSHKGRVKHIDLRIHSLREHVRDGHVTLISCPTADMSADVLTKALPSPAFRRHCDVIMGQTSPTAPPLPSLRTLLARTCTRINDTRDILCYYTVSIPLQRLRPRSEGG